MGSYGRSVTQQLIPEEIPCTEGITSSKAHCPQPRHTSGPSWSHGATVAKDHALSSPGKSEMEAQLFRQVQTCQVLTGEHCEHKKEREGERALLIDPMQQVG